jgi:hypothetical protein
MLFGQSVFQSVLDRLDEEEHDTSARVEPAAHRIQGLNSGFATTVLEGVSAASARPDQAYMDNLGWDAPAPPDAVPPATPQAIAPSAEPDTPPEPVMPAHLTRIRPEQIAAELSISSRDTPHSLSEKRRAFAKANHPDGVAPPFRENATTRMKIANLLIDEATRRLLRAVKLAR